MIPGTATTRAVHVTTQRNLVDTTLTAELRSIHADYRTDRDETTRATLVGHALDAAYGRLVELDRFAGGEAS
jgi:hypothetical protein